VVGDEGDEERFLRDASSAGRLCHPGIVTVHEAGRVGRRCYLVSAFVDGTTLARRIETGPLPAHEAADLAAQVAEAMDSDFTGFGGSCAVGSEFAA
jgi:serine/threonine-protein kinase